MLKHEIIEKKPFRNGLVSLFCYSLFTSLSVWKYDSWWPHHNIYSSLSSTIKKITEAAAAAAAAADPSIEGNLRFNSVAVYWWKYNY